MKRIILATSLLCLLAFTSFGQTVIPNGGFENWSNLGQPTEEPQYYHSNQDGGGWATFGPQTCFRDVSPHGGSYCVKIQSGSALGNVVNGSCVTGKVEAPTTNKSEGYIRTIAPVSSGYAMSFTGRPDSIVFWYKYTDAGTTDYPTLGAVLHIGYAYEPEVPVNSNHPDSTSNIIARANWQGGTANVGSWTRVSMPFTYVAGSAGSRTPEYILITSTSSGSQTGGTSGSILWLDDIEAIYNPTIATGTVSTGPFYVSATAGAAVNVPFTLTGTFTAGNVVTAQLSNAAGSFSSATTIGTSSTTASGTISATIPANTPSGSGYRIRVISSTPSLTALDNGSNIQVVLCTNSVAPSTTQNIGVATSGTQLTITETPTANSRQWQYSTTSGGPYQAFLVNQTGTTYTPNFNTAGTYYVVCVSAFPSSLNVISNQVQINVDANSIAPTALQSIPVSTNGTMLTVTESPTASSRQWEYGTTSGGPYQAFSVAQTGTTYMPNFSTAGNYYVVCLSTFSGGLTLTSNEVQIIAAQNSVAPATTQNILVGTNGTTLNVTESPSPSSREWKYGTASGGPYQSFTVVQTGASYTPNFNTAGTYYVVCISSYPGGLNITSNQVQINAVENSINPSASQSILVGVNGNMLTVTETPAGSAREWKYSTTSGGPYSSFSVVQTGMTYTPNFSSSGSYYVVCISTISGVTATSNEVLISVGNATITTGTVTGSPFLFSPNAPDANVSVPYTTSGTFNGGNVFTAQLSDAAGTFNTPVNIGTLNSTTSGAISATIPHTTAAGIGYRIRVVSNNPVVLGSDNGTDLVIDQFNNSIAPTATQNIMFGANGTTLTVTESQSATHVWKYSTTSGSGYVNFSPTETNATYTPNFATPGVYYVVCVSTNTHSDAVTSNQVQINVQNGASITTSAVSGSPFYVSPNANVAVSVDFTSTAVFNAGNVFTAQLSDNTGSFASAVTIGTLSGTSIATINAVIPNASVTGNAYRIRVISSNPAITGSDNGTDLSIVQLTNSVAPGATQNITYNTNGTMLTVTTSQPVTENWEVSTTSGSGYLSFSPVQTGNTYTPNFATPGTYYVVCVSTNTWGDSVVSNEVKINVANGTTITTLAVSGSPYYVSDSAHVVVNVDFTSTALFNAGNVFTAQLSDNTGSFISPVTIGSLSGITIATITSVIPNNSVAGSQYRIRVISSNPAINGSDNGTDLQIIPFEIALLPADTQHLHVNQAGTAISAVSTHTVTAYDWQFSTISGLGFAEFAPVQHADTIVPMFSDTGAHYIHCKIKNAQNASITSQEVVILVTEPNGINSIVGSYIKAYWNGNDFVVDLTAARLISPSVELMNVAGQRLVEAKVSANSFNRIATELPQGVYIFKITDGANTYSGKTSKQ